MPTDAIARFRFNHTGQAGEAQQGGWNRQRKRSDVLSITAARADFCLSEMFAFVSGSFFHDIPAAA
ncbi:MAG TPA: hypothetical protein VK846_02495 [Candidatus Limnocylindria bacterium]|nr:hypothetical protein [Candidatus Limnocylindria bacterium]